METLITNQSDNPYIIKTQTSYSSPTVNNIVKEIKFKVEAAKKEVAKLQERSLDIAFSDRFSFCVINSKEFSQMLINNYTRQLLIHWY